MTEQEARELAESFVNGNRSHVVAQIVNDDHPAEAALSVLQSLVDQDENPLWQIEDLLQALRMRR